MHQSVYGKCRILREISVTSDKNKYAPCIRIFFNAAMRLFSVRSEPRNRFASNVYRLSVQMHLEIANRTWNKNDAIEYRARVQI